MVHRTRPIPRGRKSNRAVLIVIQALFIAAGLSAIAAVGVYHRDIAEWGQGRFGPNDTAFASNGIEAEMAKPRGAVVQMTSQRPATPGQGYLSVNGSLDARSNESQPQD